MEMRSKKSRIAFLVGVLFTGGISILYAVGLTTPVILDEVVIISNGEYLLGIDWSTFIAASGGLHFKYLYGVLMLPILKLFSEPHSAYRMMMITNGLMQASVMPVCYIICRRYLRVSNPWIASLIGVCSAFVPSAFLYAYYARGDIFLTIIPWYVLWLLLETMRASTVQSRKKKWLCSAALSIISIVAFMAHARGVVVIIALIITIVVIQIALRIRPVNWIAFILPGLILFIIDGLLSRHFMSALYWIQGAQANTLETVSLTRFFDFFSVDAVKELIGLFSSWFFTLFSTTYGMVVLGTVLTVAMVVSLIHKKTDITDSETIAAVFSLLVFIGYLLIGLLFFKGVFHSLKYGEADRRVDRLLYDRYSYCGMSLVIFWALYGLGVKPNWLTKRVKITSIAVSAVVLGVFFWKCYPTALLYPGYQYNTIALNTFSHVDNAWDIMWNGYYTKSMLLGAFGLGAGGFLLLLFLPRKDSVRRAAVYLAIILVGQLVLVQVNYHKVRKATNDSVLQHTAPIVEYLNDNTFFPERMTYAIRSGSHGVVARQFYQSQMPYISIFGWESMDLVGEDFLVFCPPQDAVPVGERIGDLYCISSFDYESVPYDAVYVHGEGLKKEMEGAGYSLYSLPQDENKRGLADE